jgi:hypothetical protein
MKRILFGKYHVFIFTALAFLLLFGQQEIDQPLQMLWQFDSDG